MILDDLIEVYRFVDDIPGRQGKKYECPLPSISWPIFYNLTDETDRKEIEIGFLIPKAYNIGMNFVGYSGDLSVGWKIISTNNDVVNLGENYLFYPAIEDGYYWFGYYKIGNYKKEVDKSKRYIFKRYLNSLGIIIHGLDLIDVYRFLPDQEKTSKYQNKSQQVIDIWILINKKYNIGISPSTIISDWRNKNHHSLEELESRYFLFPVCKSNLDLYFDGQVEYQINKVKDEIINKILKTYDSIKK